MGEIKGMNEKVSVIMPIYNVEKYLRESIESVLNQTYGNFELFLVDDGSPDNCPKIIDEYAQMDKRIIAIHQDNAGVDAARNNAIDRANGKYIAFIDSDDAYEKKYLELLVNAIEKNSCDMSVCSFIPFGIENPPKFKTISEQTVDRNSAVELLLGYNSVNGYVWNKLFKRELIDEHNIRFQDGYWACDDVLFAGSYMHYCKNIVIIENPLYRYRQVASGANRVRYSGVAFDQRWMSSFNVTAYFKNLYRDKMVEDACDMHEAREASIVLRAVAASNYSGPECDRLLEIVKKNVWKFIKSKKSSYFQKISVLLTCISPKLELYVWKKINGIKNDN